MLLEHSVPSLVLSSTAEHWTDSCPALHQGVLSSVKRLIQGNMRLWSKVEREDMEMDPELPSQLCHLLAVMTWPTHLTS